MKKILQYAALMLALVAFAACGGGNGDADDAGLGADSATSGAGGVGTAVNDVALPPYYDLIRGILRVADFELLPTRHSVVVPPGPGRAGVTEFVWHEVDLLGRELNLDNFTTTTMSAIFGTRYGDILIVTENDNSYLFIDMGDSPHSTQGNIERIYSVFPLTYFADISGFLSRVLMLEPEFISPRALIRTGPDAWFFELDLMGYQLDLAEFESMGRRIVANTGIDLEIGGIFIFTDEHRLSPEMWMRIGSSGENNEYRVLTMPIRDGVVFASDESLGTTTLETLLAARILGMDFVTHPEKHIRRGQLNVEWRTLDFMGEMFWFDGFSNSRSGNLLHTFLGDVFLRTTLYGDTSLWIDIGEAGFGNDQGEARSYSSFPLTSLIENENYIRVILQMYPDEMITPRAQRIQEIGGTWHEWSILNLHGHAVDTNRFTQTRTGSFGSYLGDVLLMTVGGQHSLWIDIGPATGTARAFEVFEF